LRFSGNLLDEFPRLLFPRPPNDMDDGEHDRRLDADADDRRRRCAGLEAKQGNCRRDGEFKEVAHADQRIENEGATMRRA
jgi:hypothetical protein